MKNKHKKKNKKKKTKDTTSIVSQTSSLAVMTQEDLCKAIDDLAFSGPGNSLTNMDFHAWCVDNEGLVCDYSTKQLMMNIEYGTGDIVRRPFTAHLIPEWLVRFDELYDTFLKSFVFDNFGGGVEYAEGVEYAKALLLSIIDTPSFPNK